MSVFPRAPRPRLATGARSAASVGPAAALPATAPSGRPTVAAPETLPPRPAGSPVRQRSIMALAWPSLAENVLLLLMGMVSLIMVGRLGASAVAGIGVANQVANLLIVLFSGLAVGNTALVARAVGAGHADLARAGTRQALLLGAGLGVVLAAICLP